MCKCIICGKETSENNSITIAEKILYLCDEHLNLFNDEHPSDYIEAVELINKLGDDYFKCKQIELLKHELNELTPNKIKNYLDERVIGQEKAKKILSVAVYNHYLRIINNANDDKSNVLMIGPSGVGKTELARSIAKIVGVPFVICDATTVTEAGYVGDDVENMLLRLYQAADEDINNAEIGIIFIDEIDKIARKGESTSITRDVSGEGVQQALLKIIEGADVDVPLSGGRKHPSGERIRINTKNILFICSGAFEGLTMYNEKANPLGFNSKLTDNKTYDANNITPEAIKKQGIIPELVGRLPVIVGLNPLTVDDLKRILVEPTDSICKKYERLLGYNNIKLKFSDSALQAIAEKADKQGTGARGLRSIIEEVMIDIMFDAPSDKTISSIEVIYKEDKLDTLIKHRKKVA